VTETGPAWHGLGPEKTPRGALLADERPEGSFVSEKKISIVFNFSRGVAMDKVG
jgi:hypothetical protein